MGILRRKDASRRRSTSPTAIDRKVIRFRRLVEQHAEILELFADLKEKRSGEYILDRQYIEAGLDRAYEGVRRMLYDMHVLSDSISVRGYEELDRLRAVSEKILREARAAPHRQHSPADDEEPDWETVALHALYQDLARVPVYGTEGELFPDAGLPAPQSLAEWAGWGHLKAAQWVTEHLPRLSPSPIATLTVKEAEEVPVQVFLLGEARETKLRQSFATVSSDPAETPERSPVRAFLEALAGPAEGNGTGRMSLGEGGHKGGQESLPLQLYAGEGFLLVLLPPFLPLRLFWCSLSLQASENLIYFYGMHSPSPARNDRERPFALEKGPFSVYQCNVAEHWMYWVSHLSWAQGEERVRMLGHALAQGLADRGGDATHGDFRASLQRGIARFLRQTAMPRREVSS